ncbi:hypothetical protein ACI7BZ_16650 [Xanthobacter sp. AM11]|uniref:hypothetical protein n=1 Tax=Xanthobacter sp. AM11 TaxID=3380643 RepID=UPI0039BFD1F7
MMEPREVLVALLVLGAPLALFFAMRRAGSRPPAQPPAAEATGAAPPADYGLAREDSGPRPAGEANASAPGLAAGAAAAAAGGAFILVAGAARSHSAEGGGESPHAGESRHGPGMEEAGDGAQADGAGDGGAGDGGDGGGGD